MDWSPEQIARLKELHRIGKSWEECADDIKTTFGVKRSAESTRKSYKYYEKQEQQKATAVPISLTSKDSLAEIEKVAASAEELGKFIQKEAAINRQPVIPLDEDGWFGVVYGSDWHIGSAWTQLLVIIREAKIIHDNDHLYYAFGGDSIDGGIPAGPHGGILNEQILPASMQRMISSRIAHHIGPKMILRCSGCHEWWTMDAADYDFIKEAWNISGCVYLGNGGSYTLKCSGGAEYKGVYFHKVKGHSQYNDFHPCIRRFVFHEQDADIACIAHTHIGGCAQSVVGEKMRYYARTGARKNFDRFASKMGSTMKRGKIQHLDVPVLLLHGSNVDRIGHWVMGIEMAIVELNALREWDDG